MGSKAEYKDIYIYTHTTGV